mmetsp:Transcript_66483/g.160497  ORF Transcript_66483/g.160497 Transcript_66483/m.160497 type:complete len:278 (-) Transcript_66483:1362-2195(-)
MAACACFSSPMTWGDIPTTSLDEARLTIGEAIATTTAAATPASATRAAALSPACARERRLVRSTASTSAFALARASACSLICPSAKTLALALVCAAASLTSSAVGREASSSRRASSAARAPASFFASISARASARARAPGGSASPPLGGLPALLARATHTGRAGCSASEAEALSPPPSEGAPRWPLPRRGLAEGLGHGCTEGGCGGGPREAEPGAAGSRPPPCVAEACGMAEPCSSSKLGRRSDGEVGGVLAAAAAVAAVAAVFASDFALSSASFCA